MRVRVAVGRNLLAASAQLVRESPLPMLARPPVLDAVEDEKRPPVHAAASIRLRQDDAGERRAELPSGVAAHDRG
jgi:hypothetical protein